MTKIEDKLKNNDKEKDNDKDVATLFGPLFTKDLRGDVIELIMSLFKGIQFCLCEDVENIEEVKKVLVEGGGKHVNYLSDIATHLIADNPDHQDVSEAVEIYEKHVVTSRWVWLSAKSNCLLPVAAFSPLKNRLMSSIVACTSNIGLEDLDSLWAMITYHGGTFQVHLDNTCTHLICTKPEGSKYEKAVTIDKLKIVTPDWVIDSIKLKSLCDEEIYHPKLLTFPNIEPPVNEPKPTLVTDLPIPSVNVPSTQVTLRTVSLPPSTIIANIPISGNPQFSNLPRRQIRFLIPPQTQNQESDQSTQFQSRQFVQGTRDQQGIQRQVYLTLQQQPQIRPQQLNFIQIRQQQIPRGQNEVQVPVKPIILQQRIQPPFQLPSNSQAQDQNQLPVSQIQISSVGTGQTPRMVNVQAQIVSQQNQPLPDISSPNQVRIVQVQRQMSPIHQRLSGPVQLQGAPSQVVRMQHSQFSTSEQDQNNQNQQLILQRPAQPNIIQQNGQIIRTSPQPIVFQQNQVMQSHQRSHVLPLHQNGQYVHNHQSGQMAIGHPQVQRVPQLRMQQNFAQVQRGQFRGQATGQPLIQTGKPRTFMKPPPQYSIVQQQAQQNQQFQSQQHSSPGQQNQMQFIQGNQSQPPQQLVQIENQMNATSQASQANQMSQANQINQTNQVSQVNQINQANQSQGIIRPQQAQWSQWNEGQRVSNASLVGSPHQLILSSKVPPNAMSWSHDMTRNVRPGQPPLRMMQPRFGMGEVRPARLPNVSTGSLSVSTCFTATCTPIVTPKTKTTLANFLNTRLQNAGVKCDPNVNISQTLSDDLSISSVASSLSLVSNKLGFVGSSGVVMSNGEIIPRIEADRFYGHDLRAYVPPEFCLIGCVFCLVEFDKGPYIIDKDRKEKLKTVIKRYGGEFDDAYSTKCTHLICETQLHPTVQQALKENKRCITIYWLNDIIKERKLRPPYKIWHVPRAFDNDLKPCKDQIITITNFEGEERLLLKTMIKLTGAKYTNYMTYKNTVLICRKLEGNKFKKATEWNLPIVNISWLQDIMFGQHVTALKNVVASQKYKKFDFKDCFELDYNLVRNWLAAWRTPVRVPVDLPRRIAAKEETPKIVQISIATNRVNGDDNETTCTIEMKTDDSTLVKKEKEFEEPVMKKAKLMPWIENNPIEIRSNSGELPPPPPLIPAPFVNFVNPDNVKIKIMLSGFKNVSHFKQIIVKLGANITNNYKECTHLVMDKVARTSKFMCLFSTVEHIVTSEWLIDSGKNGSFVDEKPYLLEDLKNEELLGFNLKESMARRNERKELLFKGFIFYVTKSCIPSFKVLLEIASSAGARLTREPPSLRQLSALKKREDITFAVITKEQDLHICDLFFEQDIPVLNSEFILTNLLRQQIDFKSYSFEKS